MASKPQVSSSPEAARTVGEPVLWNAFANMASPAGHAVTIVRGEGSYVYDDRGRPYLDALASLWYCNVGHGRAELADAAAAQHVRAVVGRRVAGAGHALRVGGVVGCAYRDRRGRLVTGRADLFGSS